MNLFFRLLAASLVFLPLSMNAAETPATGATITGTCTMELRIEKTQILSGMELALCPDSVAGEIKKVRDQRWLASASRSNYNDGYMNLDLQAIGFTAVRNAIARAKADANGVYTLTGIQPGKYRIYAQYKNHYAVAYWLVPVEIKDKNEKLTVDLNNSNVAEAFNRKPQ